MVFDGFKQTQNGNMMQNRKYSPMAINEYPLITQ